MNICQCGCGTLCNKKYVKWHFKPMPKKQLNLCLCGCGNLCKYKYVLGHYKNKNNIKPIRFCKCGCNEICTKNYKRGHHTKNKPKPDYLRRNSGNLNKKEIKYCECKCGMICKNRFIAGHNMKLKQKTIIIFNLCLCGCGQKCKKRFIVGHGTRVRYKNIRYCKCGCNQIANKKYIKFHHLKNKRKKRDPNKPYTEKQLAFFQKRKLMTGEQSPTFGRKHTEEERKKISQKRIELFKNKPLKIKIAIEDNKHKKFSYTDVSGKIIKMRSSWEVKYAKYLDEQNMTWDYEPCIFKLENNQKLILDFYIWDIDKFIEIKGYFWKDAKIKLEMVISNYNYLNLQILFKEDLQKLGIL